MYNTFYSLKAAQQIKDEGAARLRGTRRACHHQTEVLKGQEKIQQRR